MKNFPYVLRIIEMLNKGPYVGTGKLVTDGVMVRFVVAKEQKSSITCEVYNYDSKVPALFFVVDDDDLFDNDIDQSKKGPEVTVSREGFYLDLCGEKCFTFCGVEHDFDDENLESTLFQLSTVQDNIPDPGVFTTIYESTKEFLNAQGMQYLNYISYDDCTILESDFEELQSAYKNLCES